MPDATRNRIISQIELLGLSGDSHLHELGAPCRLQQALERQKSLPRILPENFRAQEINIISLKRSPHREPKPSEKETPIMMRNRHDQHWIEHGQRTLKKLLEEMRSLDVLPTPQAAGMEPATYMCAANLDALMVTYDDDDLVADIAFRNVPDGCPELLGIVRADPGSDFVAVREIGISLILDVLYGDIVPADVRLLNDDEAAAVDAVDSAPVRKVKEQASEEARKFFVTRDGNRYDEKTAISTFT